MPATLPIVVLTPVKNEEWILDRFLAVTHRFADLILVADQGSEDATREICTRFPQVSLIDNPGTEYDEAARQLLLLDEARRRIPGPKVLLALDADEIVAADGPGSGDWQRMLAAKPGTVLCFEKPDLYRSSRQCLRHDRPWPVGYVDDGVAHRPSPIHSLRLPVPEGAPRLVLERVKILHYALTRLDHQASKLRFYSVTENLLGLQPFFRRRRAYRTEIDWSRLGRLEETPEAWLAGWEAAGIDMHTIRRPRYFWQDFEVLRKLALHGERRFWLDPVWDHDWEATRRHALEEGRPSIPQAPVRYPPAAVRAFGRAVDALYGAAVRLRAGAGR